MVTVQSSTKPFGNRILWVVLTALILCAVVLSPVASAQGDQGDNNQTVREVAEYFMRAGIDHYQQGRYIQAEESFLRALDYKQYLSARTLEALDAALDKAHEAQGQLPQAKSYLEKVKDSDFLTDAERKQVNEGLARIDGQLVKKQPAPVPAPPPRSEMLTLPPVGETRPRQAPVPDVPDTMSPTQAIRTARQRYFRD
jgi:tetratricopeptide (TPR) repeat protein